MKKLKNIKKILLVSFSLAAVVSISFFISSMILKEKKVSGIYSLEKSEIEWLKDNYSSISVAIDPSNPPVSFIDENGNFSGAIEDYLKLIESKLNIKLNRVKTSSWKEVLDQGLSSNVDIIAPTAWTTERSRNFLFTQPFITLNTVFITTKDRTEIKSIKDLKEKKIAVTEYSALLDYLKNNTIHLNIFQVLNDFEGLKILTTGEIDALATDMPTVPYYLKQTGLSNLRIACETGFYYNYSMAVNRIKPLLASSLSKALYSIPPEEMDSINSKWMLNVENNTVAGKKIFFILIISLVITIIVAAMFLIWNTILRKKVDQKTRDLSDYKEKLEITVKERTEELNTAIADLTLILDQVKTLKGLIPICPSCRKIREDDGYWQQMEIYIHQHAETEFSHSLCPDCTVELYGNEKWFKK